MLSFCLHFALGTTQRMLEDNLRRLWRKEEQLRTKEEQLRQKELLLLRSLNNIPLDECETNHLAKDS